MPTRRALLASLGASLALAPFGVLRAYGGRGPGRRVLYVGAMADEAGQFFLRAFDAGGRTAFSVPLPGRGHSVALQPGARACVAFARRPGRFALVVDLAGGEVQRTLHAGEGRHFYGHGVFSADGALLYTTENDFANGRGVIGVRDAGNGYAPVGELPAHGIGPHDIRLLGDGRTLVVANGGILTHPDTGRRKLNLPTMRPSLVYVDAASGHLLQQHRLAPELRLLSIRHLSVAPDGTVGIAMQYQGPQSDRVPLVGLQRGGEPIRLLHTPDAVLRRMRQYCGSACMGRGGEVMAVSSPRGGLITLWQVSTGRYLTSIRVADGCGLAPAEGAARFVASSGLGGVFGLDGLTGERRRIEGSFTDAAHWDNHLVRAG